MSVIIEGMKMPEDGVYFCEVGVINGVGTITFHTEERQVFQLAEIPPHGRSIDADFLTKILKKEAEDEVNKITSPISWSYAYESLMNDLNIMPTIIEAEG